MRKVGLCTQLTQLTPRMKPTSGSPAVTAADLAEVDAMIKEIGNPFSASKFEPNSSPPSAEKRAIARKGKGLFAAEDEDAVEARRAAESAERKLLPLSRNKLSAAKDALNDLASVDPSELGCLETQEYIKRRCRDCIFLLRRKQVPLLTGTVDEPPRTPRRAGGKPYCAGKPVHMHHNIKRCESEDREGSDEEEEDDIPLLSPTTPELLRAGTHTPLTPR